MWDDGIILVSDSMLIYTLFNDTFESNLYITNLNTEFKDSDLNIHWFYLETE